MPGVQHELKHRFSLLILNHQTYSIPQRSIVDNRFLLRDIIDLNQLNKNNRAVSSLDQEKVFDCVDQCSRQEDISVLTQSIGLYEKTSSARVNWTKREGFIFVNWQHKIPRRLQWRKNEVSKEVFLTVPLEKVGEIARAGVRLVGEVERVIAPATP